MINKKYNSEKKSRNKKTTKRQFSAMRSGNGYQALEDRRMLAVTVVQNAGVVDIVGDSLSNTVTVERVGSVLRINTGQTHDFAYSSVSTLRFYGGNGDDTFTSTTSLNTVASGQGGADTLTTGTGNDFLYGGDASDTLVSTGGTNTLSGGNGHDMITGGAGLDRIFGGQGDDTLHGLGGNDLFNAGIGNDNVNGGAGSDTVFGYLGDDVIVGGAGNDFLYGQFGSNDIRGGDGNDVIRGGDQADYLRGNSGDDRILGNEGVDELFGDDGLDSIFAGDGNDIARGGSGNDRIFGGNGADTIFGDDGNDTLRGNGGNDTMYGGNQADRLAGDDGDDFLSGDAASDKVFGDAGADTIDADISDTATGGAGDDILNMSDRDADIAVFSGNYSNYVVTLDDSTLIVRDTTGADGLDRITGAESLKFNDQTREAFPEVTQQVFVQPIIVSDSNGSNTAEFFGTTDQEFDIMRRIDEIYLQAGVDVVWLTERTTNNSFFNVGNGGTRPTSDLTSVVDSGDAIGVGHTDPLVLDMYFVQVSAGFSQQSNNVANGLAYVDSNGITMHVGDNLPTFENGRNVVAEVAAHEIAHNLGLSHNSIEYNLMNTDPTLEDGSDLTNAQINTVLNSSFTKNIESGGSSPGR